jgi:phenylacetate-CoA ligase
VELLERLQGFPTSALQAALPWLKRVDEERRKSEPFEQDTMKLLKGYLTQSRELALSGRPVPSVLRKEIERRWGILATENYGLTEIIGPGVSGECACKKGMHINEDHFFPEIINPDTGEVLPDGMEGELVLTTLTKEAQPTLRYRTRDITRLIYEPCECGRTLVRMEKVKGRSDDMLIIRGVNVFPSQIECVLMNQPGIGPHYEIVVDRRNYTDHLEVKTELIDASLLERWSELESLQKRIQGAIRTILGIDVQVTFASPNTLKRFEGKAKRVTDLRK